MEVTKISRSQCTQGLRRTHAVASVGVIGKRMLKEQIEGFVVGIVLSPGRQTTQLVLGFQ
ncbi:hypothetical protein D3C77_541550 [compost metagenome]